MLDHFDSNLRARLATKLVGRIEARIDRRSELAVYIHSLT